ERNGAEAFAALVDDDLQFFLLLRVELQPFRQVLDYVMRGCPFGTLLAGCFNIGQVEGVRDPASNAAEQEDSHEQESCASPGFHDSGPLIAGVWLLLSCRISFRTGDARRLFF